MEEKRTKYLFKNIGILTISNFASKILVILLVPIYTNVLTTAEYGLYDIIYSTIQLIFPILTLNISDAVMRFSMDIERCIDNIAAIGIRILIRSLILVSIFLLGCSYWKWIPAISGYEFLILLYCIFYFSYQFLIQLAKGMEKISYMGIAGVLSTFFFLFGNIVFLLFLKTGIKGFYWANILSQFMPTTYLLIRLKVWRYSFYKSIDKVLKREMFIYCVPIIASVIGWWVNNTADKYAVTVMCGSSDNGILSIAYKIPSMLNILQTIFIQAWQISAVREYGNEDTANFYGKGFKYLNIMLIFSCSLLIILTKPIGKIMYSKNFYDAWQYVPFLLVACIFNSNSGFLGAILVARKDSKSISISAVCCALSNIILNIVLVHYIGVQGATLATVISSYIMYVLRKKASNNEIKIDNYKKIIFYWVLLCIQYVIEIYTNLWYLELLILIGAVIIFIKDFKELFFIGKSLILSKKN